jgi:hypothetical protein
VHISVLSLRMRADFQNIIYILSVVYMYVEEEGNGYVIVHPSIPTACSSECRFHSGLLLSPVAPAPENRVGDHIHEAGVDLQGLGASNDGAEGVENPSCRPQLSVDLEGNFALYEGRGGVEVEVVVDPVLRREVHGGRFGER